MQHLIRKFINFLVCKSSSDGNCCVPPGRLLVFGNPLLDVTVRIQDDELLRKYSLEKNGQKEVSVDKLRRLIDDARARYGKSIKQK